MPLSSAATKHQATSPARDELNEHLRHLKAAHDRHVENRRPHNRLLEERAAAEQRVSQAQAALDAITEAEGRDVREWAKTGDQTAKPRPRHADRRQAKIALEDAERDLATARSAVAQSGAAVTESTRELEALARPTDRLLSNVLVEDIAPGLIDRLERARQQLAAAELEVIGLMRACVERGSVLNTGSNGQDRGRDWHGAANRISIALGNSRIPQTGLADQEQSKLSWTNFIAQLGADPTADPAHLP